MPLKPTLLLLATLQAIAQTPSPHDFTESTVGKHGPTRLSGTDVRDGGARNGFYTLTFRTEDLPEGKGLMAMVTLNQPPTSAQQAVLKDPQRRKTISVTCQSVNVLQSTSNRTNRAMKLAQGAHCTLDSLK